LKIGPKTVATFHYTLSDAEGEELESSLKGEPSLYLHGAGNIIRGLEHEMTGREAGERFVAEIEPVDAYGLRNVDKVQRVPIKHLIFKGKLTAGRVVQLNTSEGRRSVTVNKVGRHSADIDTNHPLAGRALSFNVEIVDVRAASADEVAHGHAHGPGGHQH